MAIASGDPRGVKHLIVQGLKDRVSISELIKRVDESVEGVYHVRGYSAFDFDLALLILRLGGRKLLYAMNQCLALPSIRALRRARQFTRIMPSFSHPTSIEVKWNLREIFGARIARLKDALHTTLTAARASGPGGLTSYHLSAAYRTGVTICWDEISQEEVACYFPHADCVGGLCREHCCTVDIHLRCFKSAEDIAFALDQGTVHFGKEVSVVAITSFSPNLRGAFPVAISPTCKSETPAEGGEILRTVLAAWNDECAEYLGPVWSFASDGDAGRRAMVYEMLMKKSIEPQHPLYKLIGDLPGLNLNVGEGDITADFDWKHEIKREYRTCAR